MGLFAPGKKYVFYYDRRGKRLDQPAYDAFSIAAEETEQGIEATVTLPESARKMRSLDITYWSTCW